MNADSNTRLSLFLEAVYREAMALVLEEAGLEVEKEFGLLAHFRGRVIGGFKADLLVNGRVILERKAVRALEPVHEAGAWRTQTPERPALS